MEIPQNTVLTEQIEEKTALVELLVERATDYGKTSYQLIRLKVLAKSADVISSLVPRLVVAVVLIGFVLFGSLGLANWLGEVLGKPYFGSFAVAGGYAVIGLLISVFLHRTIKRKISNYIIFKVLN
jgi:hypothetical protein